MSGERPQSRLPSLSNDRRTRKRPPEMSPATFPEIGSPGGTRTPDPAVNSRLLYQLSYRGSVMEPHITPPETVFHPETGLDHRVR